MTFDLQREIKAQAAYLQLLQDAYACEQLYIEASVEPPDGLKQLLNRSQMWKQQPPPAGTAEAFVSSPSVRMKAAVDYSGIRKNQRIVLPREPVRGLLPPGADSTWVPIPVKEASPQAISFAVMRELGAPLPVARIGAMVAELRGMPGSTAAYNVIRRFMETGAVIEAPNGVSLADKTSGGKFEKDTLWVPATQLTDADAAYHRREGILELPS